MISRATANFHIMTENHFYLILLLIRGGASVGAVGANAPMVSEEIIIDA